LLYSSRPSEGIVSIRTSIKLNPHDPIMSNTRMIQIAAAHYFLRDYNASLEAAREFERAYPDNPWTDRWLAAALGQLGRRAEARQSLERAVAVGSQSFERFVRDRVPWIRAEDYEHMLDGLRKAGWSG